VQERVWKRFGDGTWLTLLLLVVVLAWCVAYNRWTPSAWRTPIAYEGDALEQMATAKAFGSGEVLPVASKIVPSLGAPFAANWNDFPLTEEGLFVWLGLLVRIFGVFLGANLGVLAAHLLAAASFYLVSRALRAERIWAATGAFLFSMSPFAFGRGLAHLTLNYYWHVPLGLLVALWCFRSTPIGHDRRKVWACVATAVIFGVQNIYYSAIFFQFLVLAAAVCLLRGSSWRQVALPLAIAFILLSVVLLMNADTLLYRFAHGPNPTAVTRNYRDLEKYALKPIELFLPFRHSVVAFQDWARRNYFSQTGIPGEIGFVYLGITGIVGLVTLIWATAKAGLDCPVRRPPWQFGFVAWVILFSIIGGINGFLGMIGLILFRGTNRYSVVILALVLLFLVERLSIITSQWKRGIVWAVAGLVAAVGFFDQTPVRRWARRATEKAQALVRDDARFTSALEAKLGPGAMVFQMPIVDFPEGANVGAMDAYAHLRPYLHSRTLRFSFGSVKGRPRERWQRDTLRLGLPHLLQELEKFGFAAVMINKKAYQDGGAEIVSALAARGRMAVLAQTDDLVGIALIPVREPIQPPVFEKGWSDLEGDRTSDWRWSLGDADIILTNPLPKTQSQRITFKLHTIQPRQVEIFFGAQKLYSAQVPQFERSAPVELSLVLRPGPNTLHFKTDKPGAPPSATDPRPLAFRLFDFRLTD
jgi:hypothetical protein